MTKDERQEISFKKWKNNNYNGIICGTTGYGKTYLAINKIIKYVKTELNYHNIIVILPRIKLKEDWDDRLKKAKIKNVRTIVINTASKLELEVDLLIVDEIHNIAAQSYISIFENFKYKSFLGLTPELERQDGRHELILKYSKIVDIITLEESIANDWVSQFEVIKIPIELTEEEKVIHKRLNNTYNKLKDELGYGNPMQNAAYYISYLDRRKWSRGKVTNKAYFNTTIKAKLHTNSDEQFKKILKKHFIYPTKEDELYLKALTAKKYYKVVADRKKLLYNAQNKLSKSLELFNEYRNIYKFIFAQRIEFLQELSKLLPQDEIALYHSKQNKKLNGQSFATFNDGRTKVKTLLSVKSLIEGIDIPKLSISIVTSFTSSNIDKTQLLGRNIRKYKNKKATIIYLYIPGTQEEIWLNKLKL